MELLDDAVLLDARDSVGDAREKILRLRHEWVAIRRTFGRVVFWYAYPSAAVLDRLRNVAHDCSVREGLDLHEPLGSPTHDLESDLGPPNISAPVVVLRGSEFLGIQTVPSAADPLRDLQNSAPPAKDADAAGSPMPFDLDATEIDLPAHAAPPMLSRTSASSRVERHARNGANVARLERGFGADPFAPPPAPSPSPAPPSPAPAGAAPMAPAVLPSNPTEDPEGTMSPAFTAFPRLDVPVTVHSGERFRITIGLGTTAQPGTIGGPFTIDLPSTDDEFDLDILVVADGFGMPDGGRHRLRVDRHRPEARSLELTLIAPDAGPDTLLATISILYFFEHMACGTAARKLAVTRPGEVPYANPHSTGKLWVDAGLPAASICVRPGVTPVDLTVSIRKPNENPVEGRFLWSFMSPHAVALPSEPVARNLGTDSKDFATHMVDLIQGGEAQGMLDLTLRDVGRTIADRMPPEFWTALHDVASAVHSVSPERVPSVLFLVQHVDVAWELAIVDQPIDPDAPPYLGCQVSMGRWLLTDTTTPESPPSDEIDVHAMAIVVGDYAAMCGWRKLDKAEREGDVLEDRYSAYRLQATPADLKRLLYAKLGDPPSTSGAEAVHFSCHGEATQGHILDAAIILGDGQRMPPGWLRDAPLGKKHRPFLFLNACHVGRAGEQFGSSSGFAHASLNGGFRGFLAPLWPVDDTLAHDIALEFYERTLRSDDTEPEAVGNVLRDLRSRFSPDTEKNSATRLAYVYYGHPGLKLRMRKEH